MSLRGLFTQEANQEADKIIRSTRNLLDSSGKSTRKIGGEAILAIYAMTAD